MVAGVWYKTAVRDKLAENILNMVPKSQRRYVQKSVHDYAYSLPLSSVGPQDQVLLRNGVSNARLNYERRK
jgi:hypothetical protein